jgi:antibiotic biosynthesis monooxygenase (ABM) superfamily enzyme
MTKDEIIRMAKEADLWMTSDERIAAVERFADLVAAHEREACAKVADAWVNAYEHPSKVIAENIRKRGQT